MSRGSIHVSLKIGSASLLLPEHFGDNRWVSDLCSNVLSLDGEILALGHSERHVFCKTVSICASLQGLVLFTQYLLLHLFAILLLISKQG